MESLLSNELDKRLGQVTPPLWSSISSPVRQEDYIAILHLLIQQ